MASDFISSEGEIFADEADSGGMIFYEDGRNGSAADGFDTDGAGSGEQIEETRAFDAWAEDVEESFAQHVAGGAKRESL